MCMRVSRTASLCHRDGHEYALYDTRAEQIAAYCETAVTPLASSNGDSRL